MTWARAVHAINVNSHVCIYLVHYYSKPPFFVLTRGRTRHGVALAACAPAVAGAAVLTSDVSELR